MKKKFVSLVAGGAALALVLTACSNNGGNGGNGGNADAPSNVQKEASFTVGAEEWTGYNHLISSQYSTYNSVINDRLMTGFGYFDAKGTWVHGTELGDYEMVSENPLTVKYTINEKAVYQGGTPITCEDYYMDWVSQNPQWILDAQKAAGKVDEDGEPAPLFDHVSGSDTYALPVADGPQCEAGDREFTIKFSDPNPDWQLIISGAMPSHVIAEKIGMSKEELFKAFKDKNFEVTQKAAAAWNSWLSPNPGELPDPKEAPSFGPFALQAGGWTAGQYITLERNPDWWGEPAGLERLVIRFIAPEAQIQALQNGDVNVIEPQATQDTLDTLGNSSNVVVLQGNTMIWEHLDYNFRDGSVFANGKGGLALREAFAYCVPRADIVEKLIKPLNKDAEVMNLREFFLDDTRYADVLKEAYDGRYDKVDIEKAKEKVAESGVSNPVVRIGYSAPNQRRADTVNLIQASCAQAGIQVEDAGNADFFKPGGTMDSGNYDIALFAWSGSGQIVSGANIYTTSGQQNFHGWSDKVVDEEWGKVLKSLDPKVELAAKKKIEKALWDNLFGLPLYAHPGIAAHTQGMENVERNVTQSGIVWNADKWAWKAA